jgi:hypothetical protein
MQHNTSFGHLFALFGAKDRRAFSAKGVAHSNRRGGVFLESRAS